MLLNIPYMLWQVVRAVRPRLQGMEVSHCHIASLQSAGAALAGRMVGVPVLCKAAMADHRSDLGEIEKSGVAGRLVALACPRVYPNMGGGDYCGGGVADPGLASQTIWKKS